jgi:hypothetical protein
VTALQQLLHDLDQLLRMWEACAERKQTPDTWRCWQDVGTAAHEVRVTIEKANPQ